ncbi:hypothetical protein H0H92_012517, partial [Tricholoma furcatifolium]
MSFQIIKPVGKGVYLAKDSASRVPVAIKVVNGHTKERDLLLRLNDQPFIAPLLASWQDDDHHYIVTQYYAGSDLGSLLCAEGTFSESHVKFIAAEIIVALQGLKARNVLYRDLKPANIILTPSGHIRIVDLGLAKVVEDVAPMDFSADPVVTRGS